MRTPLLRYALLAAALAVTPMALSAQASDTDTYFRAVGEHFRVSPQEVTNLSEWRLQPDEVPVVLFLAARGGISPDAVVALRRGGRGWAELAQRYGVGGDAFHVPLDDAGAAGPLAGAYARYAAEPASAWGSVQLTDVDIVGLVNLRVLTQAARVPASRVLQARSRAGSWAAAFVALARGG